MKKIIKPRGSGKTSEIIRLSSETGTYIVVPDMDQARLVSLQAKNLGISIPFPVPYREAADHTGYVASRNISKILIDNADIIISRHFRIP